MGKEVMRKESMKRKRDREQGREERGGREMEVKKEKKENAQSILS